MIAEALKSFHACCGKPVNDLSCVFRANLTADSD